MGRILAGRYQIIRFIARGGMGEVYEAEDTILKHRLALKTIRGELSEEPRVLERFKREILLARRVSHPNICRIHDLGSHRATLEEAAAGAPPELMFLTMELLSGESLDGRLDRVDHLKESEALPILEQVASGLDAAHTAGVIHRDLKSSNIMLLPPGEAGRPDRAVITDFGLARHTTGESLTTLSEIGAVMGTPAYMAPEQVQGKELGPPADIYALGIILYEMVVGSRPFDGETPVATAARRLTEDARPPVDHRPDLDARWNAAILKCLRREPEARFASANELVKELRGDYVPTIVVPKQSRSVFYRLARRRWAFVPFVGAVLGLSAWLAWRGIAARPEQHSLQTPKAASVPARRSVAILDFRNASGIQADQWLGSAFAKLMAAELSAGGQVRVLPGEDVSRAVQDLNVKDTAKITEGTRLRLHRALGSDLLVMGSYDQVASSPGLVRLELRAESFASSRVLASVSATGTEEQLADIAFRAGLALRRQLGLAPLSPSQVLEASAALPRNPEGARLYVEGVTKLRSFDAAGARDVLQKSIAADPQHPLPHTALADAWSALGYETKAREEAKQAVTLAEKFPREQRLSIEARYAEITKTWANAINVYGLLFQIFPDNVDYGLRLIDVQTRGGKANEALVTVEALRRLHTSSSDPRLDLAEARAWQEKGDFKKQQSLASRAAAKSRDAGLRLVLARARLLEATALQGLGDSKAAGAAIEEARGLYEAAGDRESLARTLELMVSTIYSEDLSGGRKLLDRALEIYRGLGDRSSMARVQSNIGILLVNQGRIAEAQRVFDDSLAAFRQIGAKYEAAAALNQMGVLLLNRGELTAALKRYREALSIFSELGEKNGTATTFSNIAEILALQGDFDSAKQMHDEALAIYRETGDKAGGAYDLYLSGDLLAARGDTLAARQKLGEALALQELLGDKAGAADTRVSLARLDLAEGRPADAEKAARGSEEILRTEGANDRAILALATVGAACLAQHKNTEARDIASRAVSLAKKSDDERVRLASAILESRARAATSPSDAKNLVVSLETTALAAKKAGLIGYSLEARLAAAQIELASGLPSARGRINAVTDEARQKGFGLIVRAASAETTLKQPAP